MTKTAGDDAVDHAERDLYAGPRRTFLERRKELAATARSGGDRDAAKAIAGLRKPSVAAHAVNLLAHGHDEHLERLLDLGVRIRAAFADGNDAEMKALLGDRNRAVTEASGRARDLARGDGESVSAAAADQISQTLRAAMASDEAAELVGRGTLSDALDEPGFAALGLGPATASARRTTPENGDRPPSPAKTARSTAAAEPSRAAPARDAKLRQAHDDASKAVDELTAQQRALAERRDALEAERATLTEQLSRVDRELHDVRADGAALAKEERKAKAALERARRARDR